jgi:hypothetical protein
MAFTVVVRPDIDPNDDTAIRLPKNEIRFEPAGDDLHPGEQLAFTAPAYYLTFVLR